MSAARAPAADVGAWQHARIAIDPWPNKHWPFNPSIVRTPDGRWLAAIRCANYHMPGSRPQVSNRSAYIINRNVMVELDEAQILSRQEIIPTRVIEITDKTGIRPERASVIGFEDIRLVCTAADGLCAVGNAMQLNRRGQIEMIALAFDENYQIVRADPLRGSWSQTHQKNWMPYAEADDLRLLFSVGAGGIHGRAGRLVDKHADVLVGVEAPVALSRTTFPSSVTAQSGAMDVKLYARGPRQEGLGFIEYKLRGGTQLVRIDAIAPRLPLGFAASAFADRGGLWLGLAHGCRTETAKFYWHAWILVDGQGVAVARSESFKLNPRVGIEFAAGLAIDPASGRIVVSYGIEDETSWIGTTDLEHVLAQIDVVLPTPEEAAAAKKEQIDVGKHPGTWRGPQGALPGRVAVDAGNVRIGAPRATSVMRQAPRAAVPEALVAPPSLPAISFEADELLAACRDVERFRRLGDAKSLATAWTALHGKIVAYGDTIFDEGGKPR